MESHNGKYYITQAELTAGIMTKSNIDAKVRSGKMVRFQRACKGTPALYEIDSIPLKYKVEVYRRYPDLKEQADSKPFEDSIMPDGAAMNFYAEYVLADGRHLSIEKQAEYSNNCAIMNAFKACIDASNSHRIRQSKPRLNKREFWAKAVAALPRLSDQYPHSLPESDRRLQNRYAEYLRDGYVCFISKKFQNKNSAKVDDDFKESVLIQLLSHHNNLDNALIADIYNKVATASGWKAITASAVGVWREKYDLITAAGRMGATRFRNTKSMQVKRSKPTAPFLFWTLDGWDVELLYQKRNTDKKGHSVTTYHNRLTVEVVLDPCCNYPIGYAIGTHETPELIKEALRDAAKHSEQLCGMMMRANQMQYDRYAIKTMTPLYKVSGETQTPTRAKNAKGKVVEPYFGYLNKTYCRLFNNWSGFGVTTDPSKQPNSEALNALRHSFPDEAGVRDQIRAIIEKERSIKRVRFMEMLADLPEERRLPLSREQYLLNFGAETGHKNTLEAGGLRPTLLGAKRDYDCFDIRFREHANVKWVVRYDPNDLTQVLAVSEDESLRFMLTEKYIQPMALADRKMGDAEQLQKVFDYNSGLETHVKDTLALAYDRTEQLRLENPRANDVLSRFCLLDSDGQHKLPKAKQRLKAADIQMIEVQAVEVPLVPQGSNETDIDDYSIF